MGFLTRFDRIFGIDRRRPGWWFDRARLLVVLVILGGAVVVGSERAPGPIRVRYLPDDPTVIRLVDDPEPRRSDVGVLVVIYLFLGAVVVAVIGAFRAFDRWLGLRG